MSGNVLGERELIRRISEILGGVENDDCAVIDAGERYLVATTDMLHRKTDFPDIMNPWQMGWMTVAVNLSDIAAMGGTPGFALVSLGLPAQTEVENVDELYRGIKEIAAKFDVDIVGGNISRAPVLIIDVTVMGKASDALLTRSGAVPGDQIAVTG